MQMAEDWKNYWTKSEGTDYGGVIFWIRTEDEVTAADHLPINMNQNDDSLCIGKDIVYKWYSKKVDAISGKEGAWGEF